MSIVAGADFEEPVVLYLSAAVEGVVGACATATDPATKVIDISNEAVATAMGAYRLSYAEYGGDDKDLKKEEQLPEDCFVAYTHWQEANSKRFSKMIST